MRADDLAHPDELRVDLDPGPGVPWADVRRVALVVREVLADHRADWAQVIHYLPMASYGFARAINQDSGRWYLQPQVTGTLIQPFLPNLNSRGGVGSEDSDNRFVPAIDYSESPLRTVVPETVDTTPLLGTGPLLPSTTLGPVSIDADGTGGDQP